MKKITQLFVRVAPALAACLVAVAAVDGITAASFLWHQSEAPKGLDKFRRFK